MIQTQKLDKPNTKKEPSQIPGDSCCLSFHAHWLCYDTFCTIHPISIKKFHVFNWL